MKRKVLSLLLVMCMVISLLPVKVSASPAHELYVGGTNVTDYTHEISYWKAVGGGYSKTGNESDYDFSVSYNTSTDSFTLTLDGVNITSYHQESESETYGIFCTTALNICLNDGAENWINITETGIPYGIYTPDVLTISGDGNLTVVGNELAIQTGICGVNGVTIEGGEIIVYYVGYSITANSGPITVSGGKVEAYASESGLTANNSGITISGGQLTATGNSEALYTTGPVSVTVGQYLFRTHTDTEPSGSFTLSRDNIEFENSDTFEYVEIVSCYVFVGGQNVSGANGAVTYWLNDGNGGITDADADADHYNVKYDGSNNTLTLCNADLAEVYQGYFTPDGGEGMVSATVFTMYDLNIVLEGENRIVSSSEWGIVAARGLDFSGDGSLSIDSDTAGICVDVGDMIFHNGNISVEGNRGIYIIDGNINIRGGNISVEGEGYGIENNSGDINIYGGTVSAKSLANRDTYAIGAYDGNLNIYGGTVMAKADGPGPYCYGLYGNSSVEIVGGTVIASAVGGTDHCYGVYSNDYVKILGGSVYAQGGTAACGVRGDHPTDYISPSADYNKCAVIMTKAEAGAYTPTLLYNHDAAPIVYNSNPEATDRVTDLWVGGFPFCSYDATLWTGVDNSSNYGDYFHDNDESTSDGGYAWSVGYDTNDCGYDLSLNGINIREWKGYPNPAGICADEDVNLDIYLESGSSSDIRVIKETDPRPGAIIVEDGNLRIYGPGTLNMRSTLNGIWVKGNLTIAGGTINAIGGNYSAGIGVYGAPDNIGSIGNFEINAATVNACGYCGVITNAGTISVNGGTLTAKGDDENYGAVCSLNQVNPPTLEGSAILGAETGGNVSGGVYTAGTRTIDLTAITWSDSRYRVGNTMLTYVRIAPANVVTCVQADNGSFTAKIDGVIITHAAPGDTVTLTATPNSGYLFSSWNVYKTDDTNTTVSVNGNSFTMPAYPVTIEAVFAAIPSCTVTFNSNSAVYDTKMVNVGQSIGSASWPANPTRSSYTFGGWFTGENGTGTEFTSVIQVDSSITLYAKWTYSGGGGGGSNSTPPPPQRTITVTETSSEVFIGTEGTISAEANMDNAFSNSVEVKVTDTAEDAANFKLSAGDKVYPFDISLYIKGTNTRTEPAPGYAVTILLPIPENLLDKKELLAVMHKSDSGKVTTLNSRLVQKEGVWYLVFEATEFSPYALVVRNSESYDESSGVPYYTDSKGNKVFIGFAANGKYIAPEGVTVSFMQNDKNFIDVTDHWAASNIGFTTERELFFGTGNNKFSPDIGMTRAMFATVIGRLYERSFGGITSTSIHSFIDCDYGIYYGKYVDWAAENKIISGVGNSKFAPDTMVTREQMAAILYRFADFLGVLPNTIDTELEYPDEASISNYAKNAALYCQTTDIIAGRSGGVFAPQETATRAEVAIIIKRFIETVMK